MLIWGWSCRGTRLERKTPETGGYMFGLSKLVDFCIVLSWKKYILVTILQFDILILTTLTYSFWSPNCIYLVLQGKIQWPKESIVLLSFFLPSFLPLFFFPEVTNHWHWLFQPCSKGPCSYMKAEIWSHIMYMLFYLFVILSWFLAMQGIDTKDPTSRKNISLFITDNIAWGWHIETVDFLIFHINSKI